MDTLYFLIKICSSLYAFKSHDVQEKQKKKPKNNETPKKAQNLHASSLLFLSNLS